ncbi:MAG: LamG-like jellyroll fold domain-containing protein [Pseudomonadota bacterium]
MTLRFKGFAAGTGVHEQFQPGGYARHTLKAPAVSASLTTGPSDEAVISLAPTPFLGAEVHVVAVPDTDPTPSARQIRAGRRANDQLAELSKSLIAGLVPSAVLSTFGVTAGLTVVGVVFDPARGVYGLPFVLGFGTVNPVAPAFTVAPVITGTPTEGELLTAVYTASGVPTPVPSFQWKDDGVDISGATSETFIPGSGQIGGKITCEVTITNSAGSVVETTPGVGPVAAALAAPVFTAAPTITGTPTEGEDLTLTFAVDGNPAPSTTIEWLDDGVAIAGQTDATLSLTSAQVGGLITATVEAANSEGTVSETASAVGPVEIATVAPSFSVNPVITGVPTQGETLSVTFTAEGVPAPSAAIQWQGDGADISGATSSSLVLGSGQVGDTITARVNLTSAAGTAEATSPGVGPVAPESVATPGQFVVSNSGDDGNDGSPGAPLATLAAAQAAAIAFGTGAEVLLEAGSTWANEGIDVSAVPSATVRYTGDVVANGMPMVRGDAELAGAWQSSADRGDSDVELYSHTFTISGDTSVNTWLQFFEHPDGTDNLFGVGVTNLVWVATKAEAIATAGTFYVDPAQLGVDPSVEFDIRVATKTFDVFVHPFGSTDPRSDGKRYFGSSVQHTVRVGDDGVVDGVRACRAGSHYGSIEGLRRATVRRCLAFDGVSHAALIETGLYEDTIGWMRFGDARRGAIILEFYTPEAELAGETCTFRRSMAIASAEVRDTVNPDGFGGHRTEGVDNYAQWIVEDCAIVEARFNAVDVTDVDIDGLSIRNGQFQIQDNGVGGDITVADLEVVYDRVPPVSPSAVVTFPEGATPVTINGLRASVPDDIAIFSNTRDLTLQNSILEVRTGAGGTTWAIFSTATAGVTNISVSETIMLADGEGFIRLGASDANYVGDNNVFSGVGNFFPAGGPQIRFGTAASHLADWQAATSQDANSITSNITIADPLNGDWSITGSVGATGAGLARPDAEFLDPPSAITDAEAYIQGVIAATPAAYQDQVLARAGLLAYFRTADGVNAAGGDDATPVGTITTEPFGPSGASMFFDGSSHMSVAASAVPAGTSARSFAAFMKPLPKPVTASDTDPDLVSHAVFAAGAPTDVAASGDSFEFYLRSQNGWTPALDTAGGSSRGFEQVIPDGPGWQHVVFTVPENGTTADCRFYVDKVDRTSAQVVSILLDTLATGGTIGAQELSAGVYGRHFRGYIADFQIYDRALTPAEIEADYDAGIASATRPSAPAIEPVDGVSRNGTFSPVQSLAFTDLTSFNAFRPADSGSTLSLVETNGPLGWGGALEMVSTGNARRTYRVRYVPTGQSDGTRESEWTGFGFVTGFDVVAGSGNIPVARLTSDFDNATAYGIDYDATARTVSVVHNSGANTVLTSAGLNPGPVAVYLEVDPTTGDITLETRQTEGAWTAQGTASPGSVTDFRNIQLTALAPSTVRHSFFAISSELAPPELAKEALDAAFWGGSGTRSANQTQAITLAMVRPRAWPGQAQVRTRVIGGSATPFQPIYTDSPVPTQTMFLNGLTPGQTYQYVFEVADSDDNIVATSPTYRFQTLPVVGVATTYSADFGSCQHQLGQVGGYLALQYALADGPALFWHHLGDPGYESRNPGFLSEIMPSVESVRAFDGILYEWASRHWQFQTMRDGVFNARPDDHQTINENTADDNPDGSEAERLADGTAGAKNNYSLTTTVSQLWGLGLKTFDTWFPPALHYEPGQTYGTNPHRYGCKVFGLTWMMSLEGRYEALQGGPYISATQLAWAESTVTGFANDPDARLLIIDSQGVFGPVAGIGDASTRDGWSGFDRAGYRAFMTFLRDTVPAWKSVILIGGDKHLGFNVNQIFEDDTGALIDPAPATSLLACLITSGMSVNRLFSSAGMQVLPDASTSSATHQARILAWYNPDGGAPGDTEIIRTSGLRVTVDEIAGTVRFRMWDDVGALILDETLTLNAPPVLTAPVNIALPAITGTPTEGETLTVSDGTYTGNPTPTLAKQWTRDGVDIAGATASSYTLTADDVDTVVTCDETATNSEGSVTVIATGGATVAAAGGGNVAPSFTVLPNITGTPTEGETLTVGFTAAGTPAPSTAIEWRADGTPIPSQTAATLALTAGQVGTTITANVELSNIEGTINETSPGVGPIAAAGASAYGGGLVFDPSGLPDGALSADDNWETLGGGSGRIIITGGVVGTTAVNQTAALGIVPDLQSRRQRTRWTLPLTQCFSGIAHHIIGQNNFLIVRWNGTNLQVRNRVANAFVTALDVNFVPADFGDPAVDSLFELWFESDGGDGTGTGTWTIGTPAGGQFGSGTIHASLTGSTRQGVVGFASAAQTIFTEYRAGDAAV